MASPGRWPGGFVAEVASLTLKIALGRIGPPEDVPEMVVALLCDRFSSYVTGTVVAVDGGLARHNRIDRPG